MTAPATCWFSCGDLLAFARIAGRLTGDRHRRASRGYTVFNPLLYSLELILPIAGLQQTKDWAPLLNRPCVDPDRFGICWSSMTQGEKERLTSVINFRV